MELPKTCREIAAAVQSGKLSAREVVEHALGVAERCQNRWPVFISFTPELAQRQAHRVDQWLAAGRQLPLAGVPVALKDLIDVQGVRTTCGSRVFCDHFVRANATVVRKLVSAGAVILGKTNMHEFAFGFTGENACYGNCPNPWNSERFAGGSSSGSALAVALGICPVALGSDTGGSIRLPAALCGLVGLKPTYGRVSRNGVMPLAWSMDHLGPLTRTASDAAIVLRALAGRDRADRTTVRQLVPNYEAALESPLADMKIGLPRAGFFDNVAPEVATIVETAAGLLAAHGAKLVDVELPHFQEVLGVHRATIFSEAAAVHRPLLTQQADLYDRNIRLLLQAGLFLPAADYLKAQQARQVIRKAWSEVLTSVDCLLTPTAPVPAGRFGQKNAELPGGETSMLRACLGLTLPFNVTGHPAVSVPCGFTGEGLPVGMQLVGRPFDEATILRIAHHYQQATDWHRREPSCVANP
jgi:aspartyl-tRNA(Asn)/glutamyl-tRNA(Gln) amidotransferase subunit A